MNLLEAKKAWNEGKKIRHNSWNKDDWTSKDKPLICLGLRDCYLSGTFFGEWLTKYSDGWEIYIKTEFFSQMKVGQKFVYYKDTYIKCLPPNSDTKWNALCCRDNRICFFVEDTFELVDEAG